MFLNAKCTVDREVTGSIGKGYLLFLGVSEPDSSFVADQMIEKIKNMFGGIVHLDVRHVLLVMLVLVIITQFAGAEFILGAFLAGAIIKATGIKKEVEEKFMSIGYGIFAPMFYILVGVKVGLAIPFDEFFTLHNILLVLKVFSMLIIAKLPFLILAKWFKLSTAITSLYTFVKLIVFITLIFPSPKQMYFNINKY